MCTGEIPIPTPPATYVIANVMANTMWEWKGIQPNRVHLLNNLPDKLDMAFRYIFTSADNSFVPSTIC